MKRKTLRYSNEYLRQVLLDLPPDAVITGVTWQPISASLDIHYASTSAPQMAEGEINQLDIVRKPS